MTEEPSSHDVKFQLNVKDLISTVGYTELGLGLELGLALGLGLGVGTDEPFVRVNATTKAAIPIPREAIPIMSAKRSPICVACTVRAIPEGGVGRRNGRASSWRRLMSVESLPYMHFYHPEDLCD